MITLKLREQLTIPAEADCVSPDNFADKTNHEIQTQPVYWGNKKLLLGDLFAVEGEKSDEIVIEGDCGKVKLLGHQMSHGSIHIKGNAGFNTGSYMTGGKITIDGNASDYLGALMEGGTIICEGNAGHFLGGAYKGENVGMNGGEIIVKGNTGHEAGGFMRRGLIAIGGDAGDFTGVFMLAGTIAVLGQNGVRAGANMKRGTILMMNESEILPSFYKGALLDSAAVNLILARIDSYGLDTGSRSPFRRYTGDVNIAGKGEILIRAL